MSGFFECSIFQFPPCCSMGHCFIPWYGQGMFHCRDMLNLLIQASVDGPLSCFCSLAIMNNAAVNILGQASVWTCFRSSWACTLEWSCWVLLILCVHLLRNLEIDFDNSSAILHLHQLCTGSSSSFPNILATLVPFTFLINVVMMCVEWSLCLFIFLFLFKKNFF